MWIRQTSECFFDTQHVWLQNGLSHGFPSWQNHGYKPFRQSFRKIEGIFTNLHNSFDF